MADTTTPKHPATALLGSTSEEAIDLVQKVSEAKEGAATVGEKEEKDSENAATSGTEKLTSGSGLAGELGEGDKNGDSDKGVGVAGDRSGGCGLSLAQSQVQDEAAQEGEDVTPDLPSASDTDFNSPPAVLGPDSAGYDSLPRLSTPTPPSELLAESLETPPGLEPPSPRRRRGKAEEEVLPLETGLPGSSSLNLPNPFSSISLSHDDHDTQQQECIEPPQYRQAEYQQPSQRFEPLPPSQLLSATISHALSLTPPSQPRFSFQSHPKGQQNGPYFNFTYKPSSRDVISGIAPHVFDERRKRRSVSRGRRNSGRWLHRHSGGFDPDGCGRPRASPLRRSVVVSWGEKSIYLEEATHAGTITSRISIDISTGLERKDLSDSSSSSSSSSSSGESSCSPSSLSPPEKGTGKKLLGGTSGKTGPRWSRKFKLFKNIVSRMKKYVLPIAQLTTIY
ncbi:hypothetical protein FA13DRAFT_1711289 [Coprinellus micaceus]|uniref:Uncharacterized protein n=1 Tax=Coprinellus micaceus TaxID=71717 RepID=A0A4Y7T5P7_COPMI|nr:hypothetical protein FA13DRAFT_1711289 [Coprinellus micaceus]